MEIFNRKNAKHTGSLEILTSHMLVSPQRSSARNLSMQVSTIPVGSEQPVHSHPPEQCYYIIRGCGLMAVGDETGEVGPGDAVFIPGNVKHGVRNIGGEALEYLTVNSPPFSRKYEDALWPAEPAGE
ncbi:MAG: cupin domain-containing protein [Thermodesulfobacteriota bacterium]